MRFIDVLIVCLSVVLLFMWGIPKALKSYIKSKEATITPLDLQAKISTGEDIVLIDIREKKNFNNFLGHIVQTINIPLAELSKTLAKDKASFDGLKDVLIVIVDQSDSLRELTAAKLLKSNGFTNVLLLDGGLVAWIKNKLPTTKLEVRK